MADNSNLIAAALERTDIDLFNRIDGGNSWQSGIQIRGARVAKYRRYERGNHDADMTEQMRHMLRLDETDSDLKEFNDNYMRIVVDKMAGRVSVSSIKTDNDAGDEWISDMMKQNDWDKLEGQIHRGAIRDADSYVLVDENSLKWVAEPAYDGFNGIVAIFDVDGLAQWACKIWGEADNENLTGDEDRNSGVTMRLTVYQPNQVSYWKGQQGGADVSPVNLAVDDSGVEATNFAVWELGEIPLVHFVNQGDNYTEYGESELRPAIPLQDALNRTLHSMIMASEFSAFQVLWAIGMELDVDGITPGAVLNMVFKDASDNVITNLKPDQIEFLKAIRVGSFQGTDLTQYTNQIEKIVKEISQATQTPIYGITAQGNVSGDALKQLEIGLIGKIHRYQRENSDAVRRMIDLTAAIQRQFNTEVGGDAPKFNDVVVEWQSPEILNVAAQIAILVTMRKDSPGLWSDDWYRDQIGALMGLEQGEIDDQGEAVANAQSLNFERLTGGGGKIPVA